MKRIEKIYAYIVENSMKITKEELISNGGFSAQEIGENLDILRNNVSKELNTLCREGKVVKLKNRPVLYFDKKRLQDLLNVNILEDLIEIEDLKGLVSEPDSIQTEEKSPFEYLIGFNTSLKNQIEQAKAAILYPPNGLHTLIIGSTGVGKSLFANIMYEYAKYMKKIAEDAPFVVFNCADYCNNPQLLLSHIFGHVKNAFTGADKEKAGIVEKANGGILFLDEIHRLPPEGQEMIFYFMDTGTYNKLGESDRKRKANVLLICATTEDPKSTLLNTFIRRIPITIAIPDFNERPIEDKLELVQFLIAKEAQRVNKPIRISSEAIKALIGSTYYGNVGQLKSNIQLACAKGFLNSINTNDNVEVSLDILPSNIKNGILDFADKSTENSALWNMIPKHLTISPNEKGVYFASDAYEPPFNIYNIIEDKTLVLKEEGMAEDDIKKFITTDINIHLKKFYDKFKNDPLGRDGLLKIVDNDILNFSEEVKDFAETKLNKKLSERFIYAISLHFSALLKRISNKESLNVSGIDLKTNVKSEEYKVAREIYNLIEKRFGVVIPEIEIGYIALLLVSIQESLHQNKVGIIVAAHGVSTASSMVEVAKKLLDAKNICAVDMPLDRSPKDILEEVVNKVKIVNKGAGVLLLVDMGSLNSFSDVITERTNIKTRSIDMVSTPLVLEAVRKSEFTDSDLDSVYSYLIQDFRGYTSKAIDSKKNRVIVTVCSTGQGAAIKLKQIVEDLISNITSTEIRVVPIGIKEAKKGIEELSKTNEVIAVIGIADPKMGMPFISMEELIDGSGERILKKILYGESYKEENNKNDIVLANLCKDSLKEMLIFLNPEKVYKLLETFVSSIEEKLQKTYSNSEKMKIIIHVACALERMVVKDGLTYKEPHEKATEEIFEQIKELTLIFKKTLGIIFTDDEIYYIADMVNEYQTSNK